MKSLTTYLPEDPNVQCRFDASGNPLRERLSISRPLKNGDTVRMSTNDRVNLPLPSPFLLFFHDYLWKVLGSAGLQGPRQRYEGRPRDYGRSSAKQISSTGPGSSPLSGSKGAAVRGGESEGSDGSDGSGKGKKVAQGGIVPRGGGDGTQDDGWGFSNNEMDVDREESLRFEEGLRRINEMSDYESEKRRARAQAVSGSDESGLFFAGSVTPRTFARFGGDWERFKESLRRMRGAGPDDECDENDDDPYGPIVDQH
ncbi:hypothetical protein TWF696_004372 [Orbilia brochopaga]|uniref:Uncharacterized protein n=1 Tax=Orbilia brochopaga TaxID=3140254 RepID=A0AAV9V975_9PEZI